MLSDLYAMGITKIDNFLMLLGIALSMNSEERDIATKEIIRGFNDKCSEAGVTISGGQTVQNPWYMTGGVASSVCSPSEFILPAKAYPGDIVVLTKPLGT